MLLIIFHSFNNAIITQYLVLRLSCSESVTKSLTCVWWREKKDEGGELLFIDWRVEWEKNKMKEDELKDK